MSCEVIKSNGKVCRVKNLKWLADHAGMAYEVFVSEMTPEIGLSFKSPVYNWRDWDCYVEVRMATSAIKGEPYTFRALFADRTVARQFFRNEIDNDKRLKAFRGTVLYFFSQGEVIV